MQALPQASTRGGADWPSGLGSGLGRLNGVSCCLMIFATLAAGVARSRCAALLKPRSGLARAGLRSASYLKSSKRRKGVNMPTFFGTDANDNSEPVRTYDTLYGAGGDDYFISQVAGLVIMEGGAGQDVLDLEFNIPVKPASCMAAPATTGSSARLAQTDCMAARAAI